jgi:hypothetical protein
MFVAKVNILMSAGAKAIKHDKQLAFIVRVMACVLF